MAFTSSYTEGLIQQSEYYYGTPSMSPGLSGSFSGSFQGDGSQLTGIVSASHAQTASFISSAFISASAAASGFGSGGSSSPAFPFTGDAQITGSLVISASNNTSESLSIEGSGSTIFSIQGSQGQLFSVTDDLLDEVFSVADISGDTLLSVSGSGLVEIPVGDLTGSATATASYGAFKGDGSQLTGISTTPFPFTGDAQITGSLSVSGSGISFIASGGTVFSISETGSFTLGEGATAANDTAVAIGKSANATSNGVSIGGNSNASLGNTVSIGGYSSVLGDVGVSIGYDADSTAAADGSISIGAYINNSAGRSVVFNATGENAANHSTPSSSAFYLSNKTTPDFEVVAGGTSTLVNSNLSGSATSTSSFGTYLGDGSQLTGISSDPFPFTGDAQITGSLIVSGSNNKLDLTLQSAIFIGKNAGIGQTVAGGGRNSIFIGEKAGFTNAVGNDNLCIGLGAGAAIGQASGGQPSDGNIFIGKLSAAGNASLPSATAKMNEADNNIGIGFQSLLYLVSGDENIAIGSNAMRGSGAAMSATRNIAIGGAALYKTDSGDNNIGIGYHAGLNQTSGDGNITIGSGSLGIAGESNQLRIGQGNGDALIHGDFASQSLSINGSGSTVFDVIGSQGTLFAVDDDLSGTLFTANDISGLPVLEASASGEVYIGKSPQSLYTTAVISSTTANTSQSLAALSTSSYNGAFFDYTAHSGSDARAGSIMSVWNGANLNFTETTTTDIGSTTDLIFKVEISESKAQLLAHATNAGYKIKTIIRSI